MKKETIKTSLILMVYTLIAGIALSVVYKVTERSIAEAELANLIKSIEYVLTDETDENGQTVVESKIIKDTVINLKNEIGKVLYSDKTGTVLSPLFKFENTGKTYYLLIGKSVGYGGDVQTLAAFEYDGNSLSLKAIKVLDYSQETPGLGAKISEEDIQKRFYPISYEGLKNGVKVDKDSGKTGLNPDEAKNEGIAVTSDVMTGATITPRAVANAITVMFKYLEENVAAGR